jgi:hypothetical protein
MVVTLVIKIHQEARRMALYKKNTNNSTSNLAIVYFHFIIVYFIFFWFSFCILTRYNFLYIQKKSLFPTEQSPYISLFLITIARFVNNNEWHYCTTVLLIVVIPSQAIILFPVSTTPKGVFFL